MMGTNTRKAIKLALAMLLVMLLVVSCGKKEEKAASVPAATAKAESSPVATPAPAPAPAPVVVEEKKEEVVAPVATVVEEPVVVAVVPEPEPEPVVAEPEPVVVLQTTYPVVLSTQVVGGEVSIEAYDGYAFVKYPESYTEESVDEMMSNLIATYVPEYSDVLGWSVEGDGEGIIAYPFGITPQEITEYCIAISKL